MKIQTIAASILALGLLSPVAFAGNGDGYSCSKDSNQNADYIDCFDSSKRPAVDTAGAAVVDPELRNSNQDEPISEAVDE
jgi:hypothetical protein